MRTPVIGLKEIQPIKRKSEIYNHFSLNMKRYITKDPLTDFQIWLLADAYYHEMQSGKWSEYQFVADAEDYDIDDTDARRSAFIDLQKRGFISDFSKRRDDHTPLLYHFILTDAGRQTSKLIVELASSPAYQRTFYRVLTTMDNHTYLSSIFFGFLGSCLIPLVQALIAWLM